jgi:hypothetical protein
MSGTNAFKRGVQDHRLSKRITDSRTGRATDTFPEEDNTQRITSNGQEFVQVLSTNQQSVTDPIQLKAFPQFRLIRNATAPVNTGTGDCGVDAHPFVDCALNPDVTEFLAILNDIGLRIFRLSDPDNFNMVINARSLNGARDLVGNRAGVDTISANVLILLDKMRDFLYGFGKKIAPPGVNPYLNNEHMVPGNSGNGTSTGTNTTSSNVTNVNVQSGSNPGVQFPGPPYNPNDIDTFLNCLDKLIDDNTDRDEAVDFNLPVFQSIIENSVVTKFDDAVIDEYNVTRDHPKYTIMTMMLTLIKIDTKFMSILYHLNLHNAFRSPITGAKYGKPRTRFNVNGVPVANNIVTNVDIFNAGRDLKAMLGCVTELISFIKIEGFTKIMIDHFALNPDAVPQPVPAPDDIEIVIDGSATTIPGITTGSTDNIPCFLYGQILSFCDVARLILVNNTLPFPSANTNPDVVFNDMYEPSKVATIAINTVYGMKAVMQLVETMMKSDAYLTILGMIFPSGQIHEGSRNFDPLFESQRENVIDFQSLMHLSLFGDVDGGRIIPTMSVPEYFGSNPDPITINKVFFCDIYNSQASISNLFWDSGAPFITKLLFRDQAIYDPAEEFVLPTTEPTTTVGLTTTAGPTTTAEPTTTGGPTTTGSTTTAGPTTTGPTTTGSTTTAGPTTTGPAVYDDVFTMQQGIMDLIEHKTKCVFTLNNDGNVICPIDHFIKAYADYIRTEYNSIATPYEQPREIRPANRNVFNMLTRDIKFQ